MNTGEEFDLHADLEVHLLGPAKDSMDIVFTGALPVSKFSDLKIGSTFCFIRNKWSFIYIKTKFGGITRSPTIYRVATKVPYKEEVCVIKKSKIIVTNKPITSAVGIFIKRSS